MRADARRNYENLLDTAADVIEESGTDASLEQIARRAGVGIGTLYRHFPTRAALLEALLSKQFEELTALADELLDADDPMAALIEALRAFAVHGTTFRGLTESLLSALQDESSELYVACHALQDSAHALVKRAQRAKLVRSDVDPTDVFALAYGLAFVAEHGPRPEQRIDRLLDLVVDGLVVDGLRPRPRR
jgi:AcrR family transcriptional regulator